ncbi:LAQU0S08e01530g1_1 [Lachancea quebecensis]|uniref:LAQU0S08e01530g1_1 n=1 Tax=Lachancea quebecensis TaxID=1654605 RepID=A0A0N7MLS1_9SACH|nr:LAQU0S08e01530g1_1 [Lachancea quebecensis]
MARRKNVRQAAKGGHEDSYGLNEVDDFAQKREKVMLDKAGMSEYPESGDSDGLMSDENEEGVMNVDDESSEDDQDEGSQEEDEPLDGEKAYRQVFGRKLDLGDAREAENEGATMLDNESAWGSTKNEYYGADDLDDEEAAKEIEREALRQQKKHLEDLDMNDYLDEEVEEDWAKSAKDFSLGQFQEATNQPQTQVRARDILKMSAEGKEKLLKVWCPEFFPLSKELALLAPQLDELKAQQQSSESISIKITALSSYLGAISSYFTILLHEIQTNDDFKSMKEHPIMENILLCKELWRQAQEIPEEAPVEEEQDSEEIASDVENMEDDLLEDEIAHESDAQSADAADSDQELEYHSDDLDIDINKPRVNSGASNKLPTAEVDDYVESEVADVDAQEKRARKKTLRFYTSKIDQQATKKGDKFKGDDDIPYKERLYERQQRLLEEARKRGQSGPDGTELNAQDYDSEDEKVAKTVNTGSSNDYYNVIQQSGLNKKEARKQAHKDAVLANREGKLAELAGEAGENGKRAIGYQIMKNKGLTPRRKKENQNSRVKKRKKYDQAKKKLKSVRAVYSGGLSGVYEGEKTGIKKNLTKSVKFKS